jgi:AraC family transcriptional regulator, transcriptional activator of pobA
MEIKTVNDFYNEASKYLDGDLSKILPEGIDKEVGHFNVIDVAAAVKLLGGKRPAGMPYNRRAFYKISLVVGHNKAEYADKTIEIDKSALMFATPKIPYHWVPQGEFADQAGFFCLFTPDFLAQTQSGIILDDLPIFKPGGFPCFNVSDKEKEEIEAIFKKMHAEMRSDYAFKYDLIRNYLMELIHYGQKLQPATDLYMERSAASRVSALFSELLERQFPIASPMQSLKLRTAQDYANQLSIHVNYLNRVLKEQTGQTTKNLISSRIIQESKMLLKKSDWNISQISYSLGFEEVAHFSNFFKKQTNCSPLSFRS